MSLKLDEGEIARIIMEECGVSMIVAAITAALIIHYIAVQERAQ